MRVGRWRLAFARGIARLLGKTGGLTLLALRNGIEAGVVDSSLFSVAADKLTLEDARGAYWPLILEWVTRGWPNAAAFQAKLTDDTVKPLADVGVTIFDVAALPSVFRGVDPSDFGSVKQAIEPSESYDDDEDGDDNDEILIG